MNNTFLLFYFPKASEPSMNLNLSKMVQIQRNITIMQFDTAPAQSLWQPQKTAIRMIVFCQVPKRPSG